MFPNQQVDDGISWLRLGEGRGNGQCPIKTAGQQEITLRIDTRGLAAPHKYAAKLTVLTNGGVVEVPVGFDLQVRPFALPPFQDVSSPREMAEHMRLHPKPAVPLLENGEIARWFEEVRASMLELVWPGASGPPGRTEVIVLRSRLEFLAYVQDLEIWGEHVGLPPLPPVILTAGSFGRAERPTRPPGRVDRQFERSLHEDSRRR